MITVRVAVLFLALATLTGCITSRADLSHDASPVTPLRAGTYDFRLYDESGTVTDEQTGPLMQEGDRYTFVYAGQPVEFRLFAIDALDLLVAEFDRVEEGLFLYAFVDVSERGARLLFAAPADATSDPALRAMFGERNNWGSPLRDDEQLLTGLRMAAESMRLVTAIEFESVP